MKKKYSVLILFTIFLEILLLTGCGQNNDEDNLKKKILAEVEYLDSTITSILNRMNHISFQNYTVSIKQVNEEESSSKGKEDLERPSPLSRSKEIPPEKQLRNLTDIVTLAKKTGQRLLAYNISTYVRPVLIQDEVLHINLDENAPLHLCQDLKTFLLTETGKTWEVCVVETPGGKTLKEEAQENQKLLKETLSAHPLVSKILETFPGSRVEAFHLHRFEKGSQENTYTTEERS